LSRAVGNIFVAAPTGLDMMNTATNTIVYLKDYTVPSFLIPAVELDIALFEDDAVVRAALAVERNREAAESTAALQLRSRPGWLATSSDGSASSQSAGLS
jgi:hypothetical protein